MNTGFPEVTSERVRDELRANREIALIDVREEDPYAQAHPLFAVQLSIGRIELDAPWRLPRLDVPIVLYDDGEAYAIDAARTLADLGYTKVQLLAGGLQGWRESGGELFRDVNVPSKAFGEWIEHDCCTPSLSAAEVKGLLDRKADVVVLDVRRFDEYRTMSIPTSTSVPGGELVLRVRDLAPNPQTRVIVNCAGRTRSIIGSQSLVNAGIPNPVSALRNGTIGWTLAGFELERGQSRRCSPASEASATAARRNAQALADRTGAVRLEGSRLQAWESDAGRTLYRWDVRTPEEYEVGHRPDFGNAPGGQLVQETDVFCAVRGARIALMDTDGVRAPMAAHWLAQMGWEVGWISDESSQTLSQSGPWSPSHASLPQVKTVSSEELAGCLNRGRIRVLDCSPSAAFVSGHIPGAEWILRSQLDRLNPLVPSADRIVVVCSDGLLSRFAARSHAENSTVEVTVLDGGMSAWKSEGRPLETGEARLLAPRIDRYRRPYEGVDASRESMQGYLDWEFGLVEQLRRDGTSRFMTHRA